MNQRKYNSELSPFLLPEFVNNLHFPTVFLNRKNLKILYANDIAQDWFGHLPSTLSDWFANIFPDKRIRNQNVQIVQNEITSSKKTFHFKKIGEFSVQSHADAKDIRFCEFFIYVFKDHFILMLNDITEKSIILENAESTRVFLDTLVDKSPIPMWVSNEKGLVIRTNNALCQHIQLKESEIVGHYNVFNDKNIIEMGLLEKVEIVFKEKKTSRFSMPWKPDKVDNVDFGTARSMIIDVVMYPILDKNKKLLHVICQWVDVSEQKAIEQDLRKNQYYLKKAQEIGLIGTWELDLLKNNLVWTEQNYLNFGIPIGSILTYEKFLDVIHPDDREYVHKKWMAALKGEPYDIEHRIIVDGKVRWLREKAQVEYDAAGQAVMAIGFTQNITSVKRAQEELKKIEWLLEKEHMSDRLEILPTYYGDITSTNDDCTILKSIGKDMLELLSEDLMDLLDTSLAVYEKNGDYAFRAFSSGWCRLLDSASRKLCNTTVNKKAKQSGLWLCHESGWKASAQQVFKSGKAIDIECAGGIRLYCEPIFVDDQVVGAINIGYGAPPQDDKTLQQLAKVFDVDFGLLKKTAQQYKPRPPFIHKVAKKRLKSIAMLIGSMINRQKLDAELKHRLEELEVFNDAAVNRELMINEHRKEINALLQKLGEPAKYDIAE